MRTKTIGPCLFVLLGALTLAGGCGGDDPTAPTPNPTPTNVPAIPVPSRNDELLPVRSDDLVIGLSEELGYFTPLVSQLRQTLDDGTKAWTVQNRHLVLACPGILPMNTGNAADPDPTYIRARPRLLHTRHWRKLEQNTLSPGTSYTLTKSITWGASTYHEQSTEFSRTMGIEVTAGGSWGPFSASVTASYEQTTTSREVNAVTFSEESTEERSFNVTAPESGTRVYALWQLVDEFALVDADTIPIHLSPTLVHATIPAVANILFPNSSVVTMKTTDFD